MKATLHPSIKSLSGSLDGWTYRRVGEQVIVAGRPDAGPRVFTGAQVGAQRRFADAVAYAKSVLADPLQREAYAELAKQRGRRADKLLTGDYLTPPEIRRIDASGYRGQPGDAVRIMAWDDIEVVSVDVTLQTAAGVVLEQGSARSVHGVWLYAATTAAPVNERISISVTAKDRPGNATAATIVAGGQ